MEEGWCWWYSKKLSTTACLTHCACVYYSICVCIQFHRLFSVLFALVHSGGLFGQCIFQSPLRAIFYSIGGSNIFRFYKRSYIAPTFGSFLEEFAMEPHGEQPAPPASPGYPDRPDV